MSNDRIVTVPAQELRKHGARVISPGSDWDCCLQRLAVHGLDDVYFDYRYLALNVPAGSGAVVEAFVFEDGGHIFFLPYIRRPISGWDGLLDFETAYGYGGPLATTEDRSLLKAAWDAFVGMARQRGMIVGLVRFHPLLSTERFAAEGPTHIFQERDTVWLDCRRSLDSVMADYPKDTLRRLRSVERQGVVALPATGREALREFRRVYDARMTAVGARDEYHFGDQYFEGIRALGPDRWKVYLVQTAGGEIIGGCLLLFSKRFCHYHLSGSLTEHFKLAPNEVLRHTVIREMLDSSLEAIHFGGGRTAGPNDSLLAFKMKFSRQTRRFKVGACIVDADAYERVCHRWAMENPEKHRDFGKFVLRYRY